MWIFCCGAKGSGSTLKYSLVSEVVERSGAGKRIESISIEDFSKANQKYKDYSGLKVIKTNRLTPEIETEFLNNNAIGFYSIRDIRDVLVSMAENVDKPLNEFIYDEAYINDFTTHFLKWQKIPNLYWSAYEDFISDIKSDIRRIQTVLNLPELADETILEISQKYLSTSQDDAKSIGQWKSVFNQKQNEAIEKVAGEWLFNNGYELASDVSDIKLYSHSQHGEDDFIWKYFDKKKKGLIIEVGAFDGIHLSNSYALENIGWRSLCMEPTPAMYKKLISNRPKAECFNVAIVGDESVNEIDFLSEELGLLSGVNIDVEDVRSRYERRGLAFKEPEKIKVNAKTLNSIFREEKIKSTEIDCITIDVEGFEMDVLRGFDLLVFKPKLIIIEANTPAHEKEIIDYFTDSKYKLLTKLGVNLVFIPAGDVPKQIEIDCIAMEQNHPLGKAFTIQSKMASESNNQKSNVVTKVLRKIKRVFKG